MRIDRLVSAGTFLVLLLLCRAANASTVTYNFWLDAPNGYPITDLVLFASSGSQYDLFFSPVELQPSGVFQLTQTTSFTPTSALVVGITERDKDDWWDIVMFTSEAYADAAVGKRYSELFAVDHAGYLGHNELTPLLQAAHDGDAAARDTIAAFLRGPDAAAAYFDPGGPFSIIQFSIVEPPIGGALPEPIGLALVGLGVVALAWQRRRVVAS